MYHIFNIHKLTSFSILLCLLLLANCAEKPPLIPLETKENPFFYDDTTRESLLEALEHHLDYLRKRPQGKVSVIGDKEFSSAKLLDSLTTFQEVFSSTAHPFKLDKNIQEKFLIFQADGRRKSDRNEMLVTGYYEPLLVGSLEHQAPFIYPLYAQPDSLIVRRNPNNPTQKGRLDEKGNFLPYWTRAEIETRELAKGFELVYLKDPFDAFILHIQGSGKIQLRDGSMRSIHYATDNGREYNSIGKLLVDTGKMTLEEVTMPAIRNYLRNHPGEQKHILYHNKKFIFFRWEKENGPFGSLGSPLTAGRSIAIDARVLPMDAIGYLISQQPVIDDNGKVVGWKPLHRFVVPQDTGSAIKGAGRVDLFWGNGARAKTRAGTMKEKGKLYFLIKK